MPRALLARYAGAVIRQLALRLARQHVRFFASAFLMSTHWAWLPAGKRAIVPVGIKVLSQKSIAHPPGPFSTEAIIE